MKDRPLTIGELLHCMEQCGREESAVFLVGTLPVQLDGTISSWRGDYYQVALGYVLYGTLNKKPVLVKDLISMLKNRIGKLQQGWKGGMFPVTESTEVWLDNPGDCCNHAIVRAYTISGVDNAFYLDVKYLK